MQHSDPDKIGSPGREEFIDFTSPPAVSLNLHDLVKLGILRSHPIEVSYALVCLASFLRILS
jgi:hypothetical protein